MSKQTVRLDSAREKQRQMSIDRVNKWFNYTFKTRKIIPYFFGPFIVAAMDTMWDIKFKGRERIPRRNVIFMANHLSHLDSFVVAKGVYPRRLIHFIADEKLFRNGFTRWFLTHANAYPIRKRAKQISVVQYSIELVKKGKNLQWNPEGQRHKEPWKRILNPGKIGTGWLAHATRAPVVPVFIDGTEKAWPVWKPPTIGPGLRKIKITVEYGRPVKLNDYYEMPANKETAKMIVDEIMRAIEKMRPKYQIKEREELLEKGIIDYIPYVD